jgi:hypothetical protein
LVLKYQLFKDERACTLTFCTYAFIHQHNILYIRLRSSACISSSVAFMALASIFGSLNLIKHMVGLLWMSDKLIALASTDKGQQSI